MIRDWQSERSVSSNRRLSRGLRLRTVAILAVASFLSLYRARAEAGVITTIAGTAGVSGYSGDNGPATSATLNYPEGMALDSMGNLYIADALNDRLRRVD